MINVTIDLHYTRLQILVAIVIYLPLSLFRRQSGFLKHFL